MELNRNQLNDLWGFFQRDVTYETFVENYEIDITDIVHYKIVSQLTPDTLCGLISREVYDTYKEKAPKYISFSCERDIIENHMELYGNNVDDQYFNKYI
jgi:hypothetical protein